VDSRFHGNDGLYALSFPCMSFVIPVKTGIHTCPREGGEQNHLCSIREEKK